MEDTTTCGLSLSHKYWNKEMNPASPAILLGSRNFYPQFLAILATGAISRQPPGAFSNEHKLLPDHL